MLRPTRLLVCLWLLVLAGCLEFDAQEITFRYDPQQDRIDALFVYRGLYAQASQGSGDKPLTKAVADLDQVLANGDFFFWCNWPFAVHPAGDAGAGATLLEHVRVENGGLFTDPNGILCGYQFVRVESAKAFVQKLNTLLEVSLQGAMAASHSRGGKTHRFSADTKDLLREFLRSGEKLLVVDRGRLELRLPCTLADHRFLKFCLEDHFLDNLPAEIARRYVVADRRAQGGDPHDTSMSMPAVEVPGERIREGLAAAASFRFFWDNDLSIDRRDDLTTVAVGERGADELRLTKSADGLYHDGVLRTLRERGDRIEDGVPDQELQRRFAEFLGRECRLPPGLASKRQGSGQPPAK